MGLLLHPQHQPQPLSTHCHLHSPCQLRGLVYCLSPLLQCGGRTDRDLLCPKHSPGTGESGGDSGCLPNRQEPAAAEATHGPDTGMLSRVSTPPIALLRQGSSGGRLFLVVRAYVIADLFFPSPGCPRQNEPWEAVKADSPVTSNSLPGAPLPGLGRAPHGLVTLLHESGEGKTQECLLSSAQAPCEEVWLLTV